MHECSYHKEHVKQKFHYNMDNVTHTRTHARTHAHTHTHILVSQQIQALHNLDMGKVT